MKKIEKKQIRERQVELLEVFSQFCDDRKLDMYLDFGTLLGAIRHKGFIPWDDDIDIVMPRKDFEYILSMTGEKIGKYVIKSWKNNTHCFPVIRIVDENTIVDERYVKKQYTCGLWIDIFPLDGDVNDKIKKKILFYSKLLNAKAVHMKDEKLGARKIVKSFIYYILPISIPWLCEKINELSKVTPLEGTTNCNINVITIYGNKKIFPVSKYLDKKMYQFETLNLPGTKYYDERLKRIYRDYKEYPPIEKQIGHFDNVYIK